MWIERFLFLGVKEGEFLLLILVYPLRPLISFGVCGIQLRRGLKGNWLLGKNSTCTKEEDLSLLRALYQTSLSILCLLSIPIKVRIRLKRIQRHFLWVDIGERRKIHLVNWLNVYKLRSMKGQGQEVWRVLLKPYQGNGYGDFLLSGRLLEEYYSWKIQGDVDIIHSLKHIYMVKRNSYIYNIRNFFPYLMQDITIILVMKI